VETVSFYRQTSQGPRLLSANLQIKCGTGGRWRNIEHVHLNISGKDSWGVGQEMIDPRTLLGHLWTVDCGP
jgi:hypothetical protein